MSTDKLMARTGGATLYVLAAPDPWGPWSSHVNIVSRVLSLLNCWRSDTDDPKFSLADMPYHYTVNRKKGHYEGFYSPAIQPKWSDLDSGRYVILYFTYSVDKASDADKHGHQIITAVNVVSCHSRAMIRWIYMMTNW